MLYFKIEVNPIKNITISMQCAGCVMKSYKNPHLLHLGRYYIYIELYGLLGAGEKKANDQKGAAGRTR